MANGEYILFVDGDDYIRKDTVEIYITKLREIIMIWFVVSFLWEIAMEV